jgi:hypothetical protein
VLLDQDPRREGRLVVVLEHGDRGLRDDRTGVGPAVDEVHRAPRDARAVLERLPLPANPRERRQEGGVDVDDPHRESVEKDRRQ